MAFYLFFRKAVKRFAEKTDSVAEGVGASVVNVGSKNPYCNKKDLTVFFGAP